MILYSVYDKMREEYNLPFAAINDDIAKRDFGFACLKNPFYSDLELYYVGDFFTSSGSLHTLDEPMFVCNGASAVSLFKQKYSEEVEKNV